MTIGIHIVSQMYCWESAATVNDVVFSWLDLAISFVALAIIRKSFTLLVGCCLGLEPMSLYDALMMIDTPVSRANIIGATRFEKYEADEMRTYLEERLAKLPRCRSKVYKLCGVWWFKKMSEKEYDSKKDAIFKTVDNVHTDKQLNEFMCQEQKVRDPFDNVQYRIYMIPDFKDGHGILVLKVHHVMSDGISMFQLLCALNTDPDVNDLMSMKPLGCCIKVIIYLLLPFMTFKETICTALRIRD